LLHQRQTNTIRNSRYYVQIFANHFIAKTATVNCTLCQVLKFNLFKQYCLKILNVNLAEKLYTLIVRAIAELTAENNSPPSFGTG